MTREDAIKELTELLPEEFLMEYSEAIRMAIKELEQEPCEDCVSRQAVIDAIEDDNRNGHYSCFATNNDAQCFKDVIRELPSVTAQPKMGKWIKNAEEWQNVDPPYICSECGRASLRQENFCCSCGADMRGDTDAGSD